MHRVLHTLFLVKPKEGYVTSSRKQFSSYSLLVPMDLECPMEKSVCCYHTNVIYPERSFCLCESRVYHPTKNIQGALQNANVFVTYR